MGGLSESRWRSVTSALVLCAILGLSVFLFSPWHRHNHLSTTPCPFSTFEHGTCEGVSYQIILIEPQTPWRWLCTVHAPSLPELALNSEAPVRAPPIL